MYQSLTKQQLIKKLNEVENKRNSIVELYLIADSLIKQSTSYIFDLSTQRAELEDDNKRLKKQLEVPFDIKGEMQKIKDELRELEQK
ncbi:hypothetical protein [Halarcobacter sp.]|uniref:hypothetical protein n=1 Tax=Halarcobacter sp. TaxID=2321133 RepID=UPI002AABC527|nr:hypothetical protein [Halarcobacter sp.]